MKNNDFWKLTSIKVLVELYQKFRVDSKIDHVTLQKNNIRRAPNPSNDGIYDKQILMDDRNNQDSQLGIHKHSPTHPIRYQTNANLQNNARMAPIRPYEAPHHRHQPMPRMHINQ